LYIKNVFNLSKFQFFFEWEMGRKGVVKSSGVRAASFLTAPSTMSLHFFINFTFYSDSIWPFGEQILQEKKHSKI